MSLLTNKEPNCLKLPVHCVMAGLVFNKSIFYVPMFLMMLRSSLRLAEDSKGTFRLFVTLQAKTAIYEWSFAQSRWPEAFCIIFQKKMYLWPKWYFFIFRSVLYHLPEEIMSLTRSLIASFPRSNCVGDLKSILSIAQSVLYQLPEEIVYDPKRIVSSPRSNCVSDPKSILSIARSILYQLPEEIESLTRSYCIFCRKKLCYRPEEYFIYCPKTFAQSVLYQLPEEIVYDPREAYCIFSQK